MHHIPLEDREALKYALAATLVKSASHWRAFETAFEVYFALRSAGPACAGDERDGDEGAEGEQDGAAGRARAVPRAGAELAGAAAGARG